jgi:hypothetical protein
VPGMAIAHGVTRSAAQRTRGDSTGSSSRYWHRNSTNSDIPLKVG